MRQWRASLARSKPNSSTTANTQIAMARGATCSLISKAITIVRGSTPQSATSPHNRQRQKLHNPVSTFPGEGHNANSPNGRTNGPCSSTQAPKRKAGALPNRGVSDFAWLRPRTATHKSLTHAEEASMRKEPEHAPLPNIAKALAALLLIAALFPPSSARAGSHGGGEGHGGGGAHGAGGFHGGGFRGSAGGFHGGAFHGGHGG